MECKTCKSHCVWAGQEKSEFGKCLVGYTPKTNADRIRSMTDEELAMWINDLTTNALSVLALGSNKQTKTISHWYDWLRKEADE